MHGRPSLATVGIAVTSFPGSRTVPLPGVDVSSPTAAYLLQVENHPLQDGVEGLPAALPSGCCRGGESSPDVSRSRERREATLPQSSSSQPCCSTRHPTPGTAARQDCPHAPELCWPCAWQMVLLAGGCLPPPGARTAGLRTSLPASPRSPPASPLLLSFTAASPLWDGAEAVLPTR